MICSIHQPNFMPWYPFFQKVEKSDVFVILKHCQFEKNNFQNRFNYNNNWYTMSVNKGLEPIINKKYLNAKDDWKRIKDKLSKFIKVLDLFDECINDNLAETNSNIIIKIANLLNIKTKIVYDRPTIKKSTERLIEICQENNATIYLSGISGKDYMDLSKFEEAKIQVIFQEISEMEKKTSFEIIAEKIFENKI